MKEPGVIRVCPKCGQKNRIRPSHLTASVRCGKCKTPLGFIGEPIVADEALFNEILKFATVPVLVDFWAEWCGPCHVAAPEVERVASKMAGRALVLKVDTEAHPNLASRFGVKGIPNFVVLKYGKVVSQQAGVAAAHDMVRWLESAGVRYASGLRARHNHRGAENTENQFVRGSVSGRSVRL